MHFRRWIIRDVGPALIGMLILGSAGAVRAEKVHFSYLWHLEQPIYWPDRRPWGDDRYERAWESIVRKDGGAAHPANDLREIFGKADRVAVYQWRVRDAIDSIRWAPEAGAQVSYSGGLIENIMDLGWNNQLGYSPGWYHSYRTARNWFTSGGKPRCDIVIFPFHHPLLPLIDEAALRKEIQLYKAVYDDAWGASPGLSRGLFPPEMAFSERIIKVLVEEGIDWVLVSAEKISRACPNFPVIYGTGGINCDPPNRADQLNPPQSFYYRVSISRGCAPAEAVPFSYVPRKAQQVDPVSGQIYRITVVPCPQHMSWEDGYSPMGLGHLHAIQPYNDPARPMLVVLAHDGDNAWGGGYSYYMEAVPNFVGQAVAAGYVPTVVEQYLAHHPVPANDVVKVEDGAWVNADGDFGAPSFLNWNWPLVNASGQIDIPNGWAEDERNWAVITAAQNRVSTAEQIVGGVNIDKILYPDATAGPVERAWHYFLASLNSGYMYYGTSLDMEVKPTVACNEAVRNADLVIGNGSADNTPPTIWIPQRHPWNPGSTNFGPQYGYRQVSSNGDFWVWTFVYDVSGVTSVNLKYRTDHDGVNPLSSIQNETYAGGSEVGPWQTLPMTFRAFPAGNFLNDPTIDFFEMPQYIANQYYIQVTGLRNTLIDYYVEATDGKGLVKRSPIQHVWIGDGSGGGGGGGDVVTVNPNPPVAGQSVTIRYNPTGRPLAGAAQVYLHYGFNGWSPVISPDPPMTWNAGAGRWEVTVNVPTSAMILDCVFNNGSGTWDNNGGADWHFAVQAGQPPAGWQMDGIRDAASTLVAQNGMRLWVGLAGDLLYVATDDAGEGNDHFIFMARTPGAMRSAPWAKAGQVAGWDAYLADENNNDYEGWFDAAGSTQAMTGPNGGVLEGTINLRDEYGGIPARLKFAVGPYATPDGGSLIHQFQVPASINGNIHIEADEYVEVSLCSVVVNHSSLATDLNRDCLVDAADVALFMQCVGGPALPPAAGCPQGVDADLDDDQDVDASDFGILQRCLSAAGFFADPVCMTP